MPCPPCEPAAVSTVPCGVIAFLHIPKTGGSSVTRHLQQHSLGVQGWSHTTITTTHTWSKVLERIRRQHGRPKLVVIQHVEAPVAWADPILQRNVIGPLSCLLRAQGCRLIRTTVLRNASERATSAAFYNRIVSTQYSDWIGEHATDGIISFLLYNRMRHRIQNQTMRVTRVELRRAQLSLAEFDAIGRTEELDTFIDHLDALLGWRQLPLASTVAIASLEAHVNLTPELVKYQLSLEQQAWTSVRTSLDAELAARLCLGSRAVVTASCFRSQLGTNNPEEICSAQKLHNHTSYHDFA